MKYRTLLYALCIVLGTTACGNKNKKNVADAAKEDVEFIRWDALYNTNQVLNIHKRIYDSLGFKVVSIVKENKTTKDSSTIDVHTMDWSLWDKEFAHVNLYDKKFDKKYIMTQFASADEGTLTTNINAATIDLPVRKMIINTQLADNDLTMFFAEYMDNGVEKKLMYAPYKKLQLIELTNGNSKITQLDLSHTP